MGKQTDDAMKKHEAARTGPRTGGSHTIDVEGKIISTAPVGKQKPGKKPVKEGD